jgi:hypothetical protein
MSLKASSARENALEKFSRLSENPPSHSFYFKLAQNRSKNIMHPKSLKKSFLVVQWDPCCYTKMRRLEKGMANIRSAWLAVVVLLASGCASWSGHGVIADPEGKIRIVVLPVQSEVEIKRLSDIETVPPGKEKELDERTAIHDRMAKTTEDMTNSIEAGLRTSPSFTVISADRVKTRWKGCTCSHPISRFRPKG